MMDQIINHIIEHSKKESELDNLQNILEQNLEKIAKNSHTINSNVLKFLNPDKHSLGITYLLFAKSTARELDQDYVISVEHFLTTFDRKQVQKAPHRFVFICNRYATLCRDNSLCNRAIKYLKIGIERFRPSKEYLTPLHADFLCICLKTKNFKIAKPLLDEKIFDIDPTITGMQPRDMLLYYYYGGMIYIGLKKFNNALAFFENALSVPAYALDAIMVESFKKYVLVSLLLEGKYTGLSKNVASVIQRHMKTYCAHYIEFATAFENQDLKKLHKIVEEHREKFQADKNFGLVKQCLASLTRLNIQRLTQTYLTRSLADIAKTVKLKDAKEAELYLLKMIEKGEISAKINQKDGMVAFIDDAQEFDSPKTGEILDNAISKSMALARRLKYMDDAIATSPAYIARLHGVREDVLDFQHPGMFGRGSALGRMLGMFK